MWRKNRRKIDNSKCDGVILMIINIMMMIDDDNDKVDLNRNFDKGYGENSSDDPCEQDYRRGILC